MPDLLIELFSEEIPARMQAKAAEDLRRLMTDGLVEAGLTYAHAAAFATPRRLALAVEGLSRAAPRRARGAQGARGRTRPRRRSQGFLRSTGLTLDQLERRADKKGEAFFAVVEKPGREAAEIVAEVLERTVRDFPWPKSMRWGDGAPALGAAAAVDPLPPRRRGGRRGRALRDRRASAPATPRAATASMRRRAFSVTSFEDYEAKLKRAHVVLRRRGAARPHPPRRRARSPSRGGWRSSRTRGCWPRSRASWNGR